MRIMFRPHRRQDNFGRRSPETQRPWVLLLVGRIIFIIINLLKSFKISSTRGDLRYDALYPVCNPLFEFFSTPGLLCQCHNSGFRSMQHDQCNSGRFMQQSNATIIIQGDFDTPPNFFSSSYFRIEPVLVIGHSSLGNSKSLITLFLIHELSLSFPYNSKSRIAHKTLKGNLNSDFARPFFQN